ncbi:hypothetical protein ACW0FV_003760, partial [Vibrio parahaemolyticus]
FINGAQPDFFREFFGFFCKKFVWKGNRDEADKKAKNFNFSLKLLFELSIQPDFALKLRSQIA